MNIFVIPSWYPSPTAPYTGIFFREQSLLFARHFSQHTLAISHWGPSDHRLLLEVNRPAKALLNLTRKPSPTTSSLADNCIEYFTPAYTWTRKLWDGNSRNILEVCRQHARRFEQEYGKIDIIHAHATHPGGYIARLLSRELNIPFVITEHMTPFPFHSYQSRRALTKYIHAPLADAREIICVSHYLAEKVKQHTHTPTTVLHNFVDDDFFTPNFKRNKNERFTILFAGRLTPQKGVDILLHALKKILPTHPDILLIVAGDGAYSSRYKQLAKKLKLANNIQWTGALTREGIKTHLQQCDLFVLPSRHENNPVVLLEAMACGIPVLATKCGGPEEIISEQNGLTAEPENTNDLANKLHKSIEGNTSFSLRSIRGFFKTHYGAKKQTEKLEQRYIDALS